MVRVETVPVQTGAERDRSEGEPTPWNRYRVALAELILVTSWGERLGLHFRGDTGLMRCLCEYLAWPSGRADRVSIEVLVYGDAEADAQGLARHFEQLMGEAVTALHGVRAEACRYVLAWGSGYCVLAQSGDTWQAEGFASHAALLRYLGHPLPVFTRTLVQRGALACGALPLVLAENQSGVVQVFLAAIRERALVLVLDEHGALFHDHIEIDDADALLGRYRRFLHTVLARAPASASAGPPVHFYTVGGAGEPDSLRRLSEVPEGGEGAYLVRALGTPHPRHRPGVHAPLLRPRVLRAGARPLRLPGGRPAPARCAWPRRDLSRRRERYRAVGSVFGRWRAPSHPPPVAIQDHGRGRLNEALRRLRAER
jgi:hypothetical protein